MLAEACTSAPCPEPVLHCPPWWQMLIVAVIIYSLFVLEMLTYARTGRFHPHRLLGNIVFQLGAATLRHDLGVAWFAAYAIWTFVSMPGGPAQRLRKRLSEKWSSLTEVMRASLARQQQEAA